MKKNWLILFLLSFSVGSNAQTIKDSISNKEISFVEVYSDSGDLIGLTDNSGVITKDLIDKIHLSRTKIVTLAHPAFLNKEMSIELLKEKQIISLERTKNKEELEEVFVKATTKKHKYIKMKGYFRSVQINENQPHYFIDGMVEYLISTTSGKIKMRILENRTFENKSIPQLSKSYIFLLAGVPKPDDLLKFATLTSKFNFKNLDAESTELIDKKMNSVKGNVKKQGNICELQIEIISPDNPKVMKFLGMESVLNNYNINCFYNANDVSQMDLSNLNFFKEIRNYNIKRKQKNDYTKVEAIHEFYLTEREFIDEFDWNRTDSFYTFKSPSHHTYEYWEAVDNHNFQSIPKSLAIYIKENMVEVKK